MVNKIYFGPQFAASQLQIYTQRNQCSFKQIICQKIYFIYVSFDILENEIRSGARIEIGAVDFNMNGNMQICMYSISVLRFQFNKISYTEYTHTNMQILYVSLD